MTGSGRITGFINENPWTENDNLSKTTENVKSIHVKPLPNNGGRLARKMHPIEYLNQTDELHLVSLASNPATPPPFRRGNNLSEFNFFTLAAVSPPLPQPVTQLTNNITICGYPQRNPPPRSKVYSTEASCFFRKINGEINWGKLIGSVISTLFSVLYAVVVRKVLLLGISIWILTK